MRPLPLVVTDRIEGLSKQLTTTFDSSMDHALQQWVRLYLDYAVGGMAYTDPTDEIDCTIHVGSGNVYKDSGFDNADQLEAEASKSITIHKQTEPQTLTFRGIKRAVKEWSMLSGLTTHTIYSRIARGWTVDDTLTTPYQHGSRKGKGGLK